MREIKFRAWDSGDEKMWSHDEIDQSDKDGIVLWGELFKEKGNMVLMQYTGLKDKNGKEIYEGDIIRWESVHNQNQIVHRDVMRWVGSGWMLMPWAHEPENAIMEIIGNIHENPELLED